MNNTRVYEKINHYRQEIKHVNQFYKGKGDEEFEVELEGITGSSRVLQTIRKQIYMVSSTDSAVFITGETGVGKNLIAKAIHSLSRRKGPLVSLDASFASEGTVASELFGHEKGSFTGAYGKRLGRFEIADGGTIFLDNVESFSLNIQGRILRVIQDKAFERIGGNKTIHSDFRVIAATNANIQELIKSGHFRSDLYYRLSVFPIYIGPLRERKEDIPHFAKHFLNIFSKKMNKTIRGISESQMKVLMDYDWPGNVRELEHIIERSVILGENGYLRLPNLKELNITGQQPAGNVLLSFEDMEKSYIMKILEACNWRVSGKGGASEILKLKAPTLYSKMRRWGIKRTYYNPEMLGNKYFSENIGAVPMTIRIATEGTNPPWSFFDASGKLQGFDVDIANALCIRMGIICEVIAQNWDEMILGLMAKKYDAIVAGIAITESRKQQFSFTNKYKSGISRFVAMKESNLDTTPDGMIGKRIGTQRGTIQADYLEKYYPSSTIRLYDTLEAFELDLIIGRLDAIISNKVTLLMTFLNSPRGEEFDFFGPDLVLSEGEAIALRKEDTKLRERFNEALDEIRLYGIYDKITEKYFPFKID